MSRFYSGRSVFLRGILSLFLLGSCGTKQELTPRALFEVKVIDGSGSGYYQVGDTVHIWADLSDAEKVFKEWQGDEELLTDAHSAHATLQMPAHSVDLKATYMQVPFWTANQETIAGRRVFYYFPKEPIGVITLYHGSGGNAAEWTETSAERRLFAHETVAAGYAVVATESQDRLNKEWNMSDSASANPDIQAIQSILDTFRTRGLMTSATPIFGVGMSQGARFVSLIAHVLGFRAVAIHCGTSNESVMKMTAVPTVWCLAQRDLIIRNERQAVPLHQLLEERGVRTELYINPPSPLYLLRFPRIRG